MRGAPVIPGSYDPAEHSLRFRRRLSGTSIVQQQFKDECDVNVIVRRFGVTGELPQGLEGGMFGDFSGIEDFESAVARIDEIRGRFAALPAEVREKYRNDPTEMWRAARAMSDDELVKATTLEEPAKPEEKAPA